MPWDSSGLLIPFCFLFFYLLLYVDHSDHLMLFFYILVFFFFPSFRCNLYTIYVLCYNPLVSFDEFHLSIKKVPDLCIG